MTLMRSREQIKEGPQDFNLSDDECVGTSIPRRYPGDGRLGTVENTRQPRRNYRSALMGSMGFVPS